MIPSGIFPFWLSAWAGKPLVLQWYIFLPEKTLNIFDKMCTQRKLEFRNAHWIVLITCEGTTRFRQKNMCRRSVVKNASRIENVTSRASMTDWVVTHGRQLWTSMHTYSRSELWTKVVAYLRWIISKSTRVPRSRWYIVYVWGTTVFHLEPIIIILVPALTLNRS